MSEQNIPKAFIEIDRKIAEINKQLEKVEYFSKNIEQKSKVFETSIAVFQKAQVTVLATLRFLNLDSEIEKSLNNIMDLTFGKPVIDPITKLPQKDTVETKSTSSGTLLLKRNEQFYLILACYFPRQPLTQRQIVAAVCPVELKRLATDSKVIVRLKPQLGDVTGSVMVFDGNNAIHRSLFEIVAEFLNGQYDPADCLLLKGTSKGLEGFEGSLKIVDPHFLKLSE
jgi:hypothetical protein